MYGSKNILFMLPLFKKERINFKLKFQIKFSNFSYPGSREVLISAKIMISRQKCCCHLMQDSVQYLCAQCGYDLTSKKPNHCRIKKVATTKLRLRIWAYSLGEYWHVLLWQGLTLHHNTYGISQEDDNFLEWIEKSW